MKTVREETFDLLRGLGLTTIFGNPGSTEEPFLRDLPADFRYILGLQEASVLGMADGYAQATGRPVLVNLHTAPGVGNAMGNLVNAWHGKAPLVITAGQQVRRMMALEPLLYSRDAMELPKPYVKWSYEPARAQDVPRAIARAYFTALQPPMGPVFVSLPMDDWEQEADPYPPREVTHRMPPDPAALRSLAELLASDAPLAFVVGAGVDRSGAWDATVRLAERTRAAVFGAPETARAAFPEDHPQFQSHLPFAEKPVAEKLAEYKIVLTLGAPVFTYYPDVPGPAVREATRLVQITDDPAEAARAVTGDSIVGDIRAAVEQLLELLPASVSRPAPPAKPAKETPEAKTPMPPAWVLHTLGQHLPANAVLVNEALSSATTMHQQIAIKQSGGFYTAAGGGLGWAMPASVGLQLAQPDRPVVCLIGEGSSLYSVQSLWTAASHHLPVLFIIINNGGYVILKSFQNFLGLKDVPGLEMPGIDYLGLARAFGCRTQRITEPAELESALPALFQSQWSGPAEQRGPMALEVMVDHEVPPLLPKG